MARISAFWAAILLVAGHLNAQKVINHFQELLDFADAKNITAQSGDLKILQAKKAKLAAKVAIPDPTLNNTFNFTNNTQLPVNLFPAEIFGGQPGEYREVQTGVQYNTAFSTNLEVKLLNLEAWGNLKLAKINIEINETDKRLNQKSLHENLAAAYFNIVQLQAQLESSRRNLAIADTLLQVVKNKFSEGLAKQQDLNDSRVNQLNTQENVRQIEFLITQQVLALKILADIPNDEYIQILEKPAAAAPVVRPEIAPSALLLRSNELRERSSATSLKKANQAFLPSLSFVANNAYNQYNPNFTVFGGNWIHNQYLGLRLNLNLPNSNSVANQSKAKYDLLLAQISTEQARIKSDLQRQQLATDWDKAVSQHTSYAQVLILQRDTYFKNLNLYEEGLQGIDRTLTSFSAMINAEYNFIAGQVSVSLAQAKIDINNKFN